MAHPHKSKRHIPSRDQAQITSFFSSTSSTEAPVSTRTTLAPPPPPSQIQSSLLNVGMRVRKSVPEGYKTGKLSPSPTSPLTPQSGNSRGGVIGSYFGAMAGSENENDGGSKAYGGRAELTPFCGLHKTGGLIAPPQQSFNWGFGTSVARGVDAYSLCRVEDDPFKSLNSSQESNVSTESSAGRKRVLNGVGHYFAAEENDEEEDLDFFMDGAATERKIAVPKGARGRKGVSGAPQALGVTDHITVHDDFAEADFLRPQEDLMEL